VTKEQKLSAAVKGQLHGNTIERLVAVASGCKDKATLEATITEHFPKVSPELRATAVEFFLSKDG
jgi:hypothetical protein